MVGKKEMSHVIVDEDNALMDPRIMVLQHEIENDPMYKRLHQKNRDKTDR